MSDVTDRDLVRRTRALLEPGEIDLAGAIVHTDVPGEEDIAMHRATVEIGGLIAEYAGYGDDWYVYSGNDDPDFASNQHQGLTLPDEDFVWECQQLLREGTFDLVFYYEADVEQAALLAAIEAAGYDVIGVEVD